ncbi:hypothetical protein amb0920 [Paramagnetospirillum magneticum AMB-1]|uniref:Uncharacterized protein n=1 Tax=Paramagnetospirillum magneticum (strain ATCC 700264 / AMB-1) TaxID=342108 RepID=Q2W8V1_PARM1|nr:hypothetical protein amb0920 [Paramagnetospirillum magneticum AMB-1]
MPNILVTSMLVTSMLVTSMLISPVVHHCRFLRIKSQMPTPRVS